MSTQVLLHRGSKLRRGHSGIRRYITEENLDRLERRAWIYLVLVLWLTSRTKAIEVKRIAEADGLLANYKKMKISLMKMASSSSSPRRW